MKWIKLIGWIGVLSMTIALFNGFANGDFFKDGSLLLENPWGIVSMVDLYVGFLLFSVWIAYREKRLLTSAVWIFFMMILGFFTGAIYMLYAAYSSKGSMQRFWMGKDFPS